MKRKKEERDGELSDKERRKEQRVVRERKKKRMRGFQRKEGK